MKYIVRASKNQNNIDNYTYLCVKLGKRIPFRLSIFIKHGSIVSFKASFMKLVTIPEFSKPETHQFSHDGMMILLQVHRLCSVCDHKSLTPVYFTDPATRRVRDLSRTLRCKQGQQRVRIRPPICSCIPTPSGQRACFRTQATSTRMRLLRESLKFDIVWCEKTNGIKLYYCEELHDYGRTPRIISSETCVSRHVYCTFCSSTVIHHTSFVMIRRL